MRGCGTIGVRSGMSEEENMDKKKEVQCDTSPIILTPHPLCFFKINSISLRKRC